VGGDFEFERRRAKRLIAYSFRLIITCVQGIITKNFWSAWRGAGAASAARSGPNFFARFFSKKRLFCIAREADRFASLAMTWGYWERGEV
jgi:hypothetical protein